VGRFAGGGLDGSPGCGFDRGFRSSQEINFAGRAIRPEAGQNLSGKARLFREMDHARRGRPNQVNTTGLLTYKNISNINILGN